MTLKNKRLCVIDNYIPHKTPKFASDYKRKIHYNKWLMHYKDELIEMYYIFYKNISNRYEENKFDHSLFSSNEYHNTIYDDKIFINPIFIQFCRMIYSSSSKYIDDLKN